MVSVAVQSSFSFTYALDKQLYIVGQNTFEAGCYARTHGTNSISQQVNGHTMPYGRPNQQFLIGTDRSCMYQVG